MSGDKSETSDTEGIAFNYKPSFYELEEEGIDSVILTKEGELIELYGKEKLCRCALCPASTTFINLKIFYTYGPYFKYYLVQIRDQLYIVKKENRNTLKHERTLESVSHFSVEDRDSVGKPKLLVWSIGNQTPSVVNVFYDFRDESETARFQIIPSTILKIKSQSKALETRIRQTEKVIFDKTMLASRMCASNTFNHQEKLPPTCNSGNSLFKVLGEEKPNSKPPAKICPISCGKPWLRVLPDFMVVGLYVSNLQECEIRTLTLTALDPSMQFLKTVVFRTSRSFSFSGELADFKPTSYFAGRTHGYVIGIMKEPIFTQKSLVIELILGFTIENEKRIEQTYIGDIQVSHESLISSSLLPFQDKKEVADLLVLIAASCTSDIVYRIDEKSPKSLTLVLLEMGFTELDKQFFIHDFSKGSTFSGMVILIIKEETYSSLRIYFRKNQQLYLFVVALKNKLGSFGHLEERPMEPISAICSKLDEEIKTLHKFFESSLTHSKSAEKSYLPVDSQFLSQILCREIETEKFFPLLHEYEEQLSS